ncbi:MAG: BamA/TamA family outer membrane protein [Gemmatimonadetes bacterium]|nr:BamA/TamA family outer membrane protein [Gemmatimonadota bacterium]
MAVLFLAPALRCGSPTPLYAQSIEEPRLVVRGLDFRGNHAIDGYTLRTSIATTESSWLVRFPLTSWIGAGEKRYLDVTEFRRDLLRLVLLYRVSGYLQVRVDTIVRRSKDAARIQFLIREGPPVRVRSIDISGVEGIVPLRDLLHDIPLAVGHPFNRIRFEWAADTIRAAVRDRGYPFAEVFRSYDVHEDSLSARIRFELEPGARGRVDSVIVEGAREIAPDVVRRMIPIRSGAWFSQSALYRSQRDLYRLGVFGYVNVTLADSAPQGPADSSVAVRVQVTEGTLRRLRMGVGYGTVDCFRGLASWSASNVLGGGRVLDLTARVSKLGAGDPLSAGFENWPCGALKDEVGTERFRLNYNVAASFQEPFLFSRLTRGTVSLSAERHSEIQAYRRDALSANLSVTRETRWDLPVTAGYSVSLTRTFAEPAIFCSFLSVCRLEDAEPFSEQRLQSMVTLGFVRDRSNSVLDPTRGSTLSAEARYASRLLGSDSLIQFAKGVMELAVYYPIGRRTTLAWRVRGGGIVSPALGFSGQSVRYIPPSERFYAGGANSVRGYGQNRLGPVVRVVNPERGDTVLSRDSPGNEVRRFVPDTLTAATGGNSLIIANAELRFPLPGFGARLSGAAFVDLGQLFERGKELVDFSKTRVTPGLGLRIATPIGPMRFDVGYNGYQPEAGPLYRKEGPELVLLNPLYRPGRSGAWVSRHLVFHFSVGQAF